MSAGSEPFPTPPPIVEVFFFAEKLVRSAVATVWAFTTYTSTALRFATQPLIALATALYKPVSYLLAPFFLAVKLPFDIFVSFPLSIFRQILVDLYPVYAFLIVTFIFAALIGLCARGFSYVLRAALVSTPVNQHPEATGPPRVSRETKIVEGRAAKKVTVSVKEEQF